MTAISFRIPDPPSLNNIYANFRGGRIKTKSYRKWRKAGAYELAYGQRIGRFEERVDIVLSLPKHLRGDCDNRCKAAGDLLVAAGILRGDSKRYVASFRAEWTDGPHSIVTITPTIKTPVREEGAGQESREDAGVLAPSSEASTEAATAGKVPPAPGANSGNDIDDDIGIPAWLDRRSPECTVGRRGEAA